MGSGAVGELHTRRVDRGSNGECLGRSCLAWKMPAKRKTNRPHGGSCMRRREFIKLLAGTAVALPVAVRSQQPSIWTIEFFNISREPCVDSTSTFGSDCAFFVASAVTAPEHQPEWSIAAVTER